MTDAYLTGDEPDRRQQQDDREAFDAAVMLTLRASLLRPLSEGEARTLAIACDVPWREITRQVHVYSRQLLNDLPDHDDDELAPPF